MRITNLDLYSPNFSEAITFSLRDYDPSAQYMVRTIAGLDAEEIIPKYYGSGLKTKPKYYDLSMKEREIVLRVVLSPRFRLDESYSDVRDTLYRAISSTRGGQVTLSFIYVGTTVAQISGFITKFEVAYFNKLPEVQLTIKCDNPLFRAVNPVVFSGPDLKTTNPINIPDSLSTSPHGLTLQVTFKASSPAFTIQDAAANPEWVFKVIPNGGFITQDQLYISTEFGNKYLYMVRAGVTTHLVDKLQPTSISPVIFPGANFLHFPELDMFNWNKIQYYPAYWGV